MRKHEIMEWLDDHNVEFDSTLTKPELFELASANKPRKEYEVRVFF